MQTNQLNFITYLYGLIPETREEFVDSVVDYITENTERISPIDIMNCYYGREINHYTGFVVKYLKYLTSNDHRIDLFRDDEWGFINQLYLTEYHETIIEEINNQIVSFVQSKINHNLPETYNDFIENVDLMTEVSDVYSFPSFIEHDTEFEDMDDYYDNASPRMVNILQFQYMGYIIKSYFETKVFQNHLRKIKIDTLTPEMVDQLIVEMFYQFNEIPGFSRETLFKRLKTEVYPKLNYDLDL